MPCTRRSKTGGLWGRLCAKEGREKPSASQGVQTAGRAAPRQLKKGPPFLFFTPEQQSRGRPPESAGKGGQNQEKRPSTVNLRCSISTTHATGCLSETALREWPWSRKPRGSKDWGGRPVIADLIKKKHLVEEGKSRP